MLNMKPGEVQTYLPPPPHKIVEYLNGHIIGHYVMKKATSVAVYNHFCNINFSRLNNEQTALGFNDKMCHEEALVEDAKHYFNRDVPSVAKVVTDETVEIKFDDDDQEYMSPVVARVIIEAASHKVRLRGPNVLTFDSTGSSKPVNAISSTIAQLFEIPFIKCDCSQLSPIANVREPPEVQSSPSLRNKLLRTYSTGAASKLKNPQIQRAASLQFLDRRRGSLGMLMEGCDEKKETINSVISKLYRKAEFNLPKAQRAIIFLDGMDKIGENANISETAKKQVLKEILQVLDGTNMDVTRADSSQTEYIDTSQIFFVVFGNFEENSSNSRRASLVVQQEPKISPSQSSSSGSSDSGNGSGGGHHRSAGSTNNLITNVTNETRRYSSDRRSEEGYSSEDDESYEGLRENKLAQSLLNGDCNPINYYQSLWGMKDVQLKFTPEALEVIANQATIQNAGQDGIDIILEKLFLSLKFDMLGSDIIAIEINEDVVLGKKRPNYIRKPPKKLKATNNVRKSSTACGFLSAIDEELTADDNATLIKPCRYQNRQLGARCLRLPSRLTDYEMAILEQLEI